MQKGTMKRNHFPCAVRLCGILKNFIPVTSSAIESRDWSVSFHVTMLFQILWLTKFYSHQLMHFFIQLCISLLSCIKIT